MSITTPVARRILLIACLLAGTIYLVLVSSQYLAFRVSEKADLGSLQRAIRLEPWNAGYRYQVGEFYSWTQRPQEAADSYRTAAQLNPHESGYWLSLASADNSLGLARERRNALQNAVAADPKDPKVAWTAGNFLLAEGDVDSALKQLRLVLESSSRLSAMALELCWQEKPDVDSLLREAIPPNAGNYSSFLELLMYKGESDSAASVWSRMVDLRQPVRLGIVMEYVRYLVGRHQPTQAGMVWRQAAELSNLKNYQPSSDNLVVNANFSSLILNGGFDWSYEKRSDVNLALDPTEPHLSLPSLLISYDSRGLEDSGIRQSIPIEPATVYQFSAYFKTQNMEGAGGPHFVLQDFYSGEPFFASEELKGAAAWTRVSGEFKTGPETRLLVLRIGRIPAGSPIRGRLWIDNIQLQSKHEENIQ